MVKVDIPESYASSSQASAYGRIVEMYAGQRAANAYYNFGPDMASRYCDFVQPLMSVPQQPGWRASDWDSM